MKSKLAKLIDVKSIVTLCLTVVFCVLALRGVLTGQEFLTIFTTIIAFYFGTQVSKKAQEPSGGYTGPQEGHPAAENTPVKAEAAVDQAMENDVHPPDTTAVTEW